MILYITFDLLIKIFLIQRSIIPIELEQLTKAIVNTINRNKPPDPNIRFLFVKTQNEITIVYHNFTRNNRIKYLKFENISNTAERYNKPKNRQTQVIIKEVTKEVIQKDECTIYYSLWSRILYDLCYNL